MGLRRFRPIVIAILMSLPPTLAGEAEPLPRSVLAITQSSPSSGGAIALFQALRSDPIINSTSRVGVYTEHLDLNRFPSSQYRLQTRNYLRKKYRDTRIGVVIVDGPIGLDLVLSWRAEMWPEVPVVFYGLDELSAAQQKLSPNVTGIVAQQTFQGMVNTARVLVPGFKRVALVGDPPGRDTYRLNYGPDVAALAAEVELIDLTGMAVTEVRKRVAVLPNDAVVFYTSIFVDGAGVVHTPQSALLAISGATSRPIITDVESNLGYGAVGGFLFSIESAARETVRLASRILDGENISQIPVTKIDLNKPMFDWRELKRWNIRENRLPVGSDIRFRSQSMWDQYRWQISAVTAVLFLQTALIFGLFYEHRKRRLAQAESMLRANQLAHMNRTATAGELSASIAHEVKQPLAAIITFGSAGLRWLTKQTPNVEETRRVLRRIVDESERASRIIDDIRAMFRKDMKARETVDVNELISETLLLLEHEAKIQRVSVQASLSEAPAHTFAERIQLKQVLLNLMVNAIESMSSTVSGPRVLAVSSSTDRNGVLITVQDSGPGIQGEDHEKIFEMFYTTKPQGMGIGLAMCRSIIESHSGRLQMSASGLGGCTFQVFLPS